MRKRKIFRQPFSTLRLTFYQYFLKIKRFRPSVFTLKVKHSTPIKNCQIFSKVESSMNDCANNPSLLTQLCSRHTPFPYTHMKDYAALLSSRISEQKNVNKNNILKAIFYKQVHLCILKSFSQWNQMTGLVRF